MFFSIRTKISSFWLAAASVLIGLILVIFPSLSINLFCTGLGIALIVYGLLGLLRYWQGVSSEAQLFSGLVVIIFGLLFLSVPKIIVSILPFMLGALLLCVGLFKIPGAVDAFRAGFSCRWLLLFSALIPTALGIVLLFNPFGVATAMISFFGLCLMVNGALDIFGFFFGHKEMKK